MPSEKLLELLPSLIDRTAYKTRINRAFIEKDFWAITLLKRVLSLHPDLVFKGGTSLSKCHHIINRFSEDVDISLTKPHYPVGERRKLVHGIEKIIAEEGMTLQTPPEQIRSRRAFNRYVANYDTVTAEAGMDNTVILELACQTPCFPMEKGEVQTFVGEFLEATRKADLAKELGLEKFELNVQALERTFVDKVFALCDYHISKKLRRQSRHVYDLVQILPKIQLDDSLRDLFVAIRDIRRPLPNCYSAQERMSLAALLQEALDQETFKEDYEARTFTLLYDRVTYEQCVPAIKEIIAFLKSRSL